MFDQIPQVDAARSAELPNSRLVLQFVYGYNGTCIRAPSAWPAARIYRIYILMQSQHFPG